MTDFHDEMRNENPRKSLVDWYEWVTSGDCPCCFPEWDYDDISILDVWTWQDQVNVYDLGIAFDKGASYD